jgi:fumarate hydratase class II
MNANEVISNRAIEILGGEKGSKFPVHPNDHVNLCQSSNDVIPTAIHISAAESIQKRLKPVLKQFQQDLEKKRMEFKSVVKLGRTHLQDATPVLLGQEFEGYAAMISASLKRLELNLNQLLELALGGTAVGTGINRHRDFPKLVIQKINEKTGLKFIEARSHFEAQGSRDAAVQISATLKTLAVSVTKIANDIRWLGSGPYGGIGEITIPAVQPGSSIMPGKVNPVIIESVLQVAARVIGNDATVTLAGMSGNFELNVMMPVLGYALLQSIHLLASSLDIFTRKVIRGIKVDEKRCHELVEKSLAMVTALTPVIGYDRAAEIAREAFASGKSLKTVILDKKLMDEKQLSEILNPLSMTKPGT